jgi:hypothetical protein
MEWSRFDLNWPGVGLALSTNLFVLWAAVYRAGRSQDRVFWNHERQGQYRGRQAHRGCA